MTDRQSMTQDGHETALAIRAQTHARIVEQRSFGNDRIATTLQFDGQGRSGPIAVLNIRDRLLLMNAFVMTFEVVKPDGAVGGNSENRSFVRNPSADARENKAESDAVVISAQFDSELGSGCVVPQGDSRAVTDIHRSRVHPASEVTFAHPVPLDRQDRAFVTYIYLSRAKAQ